MQDLKMQPTKKSGQREIVTYSRYSAGLHAMQVALLALVVLGMLVGCFVPPTSTSTGTQPTTPGQQPPTPAAPTQPAPTPLQVGSVVVQPQNAALAPGKTMQFTATSSSGGQILWLVNGVAGGNSTVGTIDAKGNYTAPTITQSENVVVYAALAGSQSTNYATAPVALIQPGQIFSTRNPQVAVYALYLPAPGTVTIQFGPSTSYGKATWAVPSPSVPNNYGGEVNLEVAGMLASTLYHLQATVKLANGVTYTDTDHTFTTGAAPQTAPVQITTPSGQTPQPGIELFDTALPNVAAQAVATDLQGNVIWTYGFQGSNQDVLYPIQPLPNGNFLVLISYLASQPNLANTPGTIDVVREVDLAGNTINELSIATLNQSLAAEGSSLTLTGFHHDVLMLPNGHKVLLTAMTQPYTNLPGYPGTTTVIGDVLVDVDQNNKPDWIWNSFDHLDINRHPFKFPDWTHSNALLYSADDHNLLLSIRHQNWIIKIDFQDGTGTGNILWHLGEGGDFRLIGGTDPTDWFYAQHGPNFFSTNTTGVFRLGVMDNGDDRQFPAGVTCDSSNGGTGSGGSAPACLYSTVPELQVDETAMTATLLFHYFAPASLYNYFGGNADLLPNGDIDADFCAAKAGSTVLELDPTQNPAQTVWQAFTPGYQQYRAHRLPSLYPGVQW